MSSAATNRCQPRVVRLILEEAGRVVADAQGPVAEEAVVGEVVVEAVEEVQRAVVAGTGHSRTRIRRVGGTTTVREDMTKRWRGLEARVECMYSCRGGFASHMSCFRKASACSFNPTTNIRDISQFTGKTYSHV